MFSSRDRENREKTNTKMHTQTVRGKMCCGLRNRSND